MSDPINLEPLFQKLENLNTDYTIGDDLREYLKKPADVQKYIKTKLEILEQLEKPNARVKALGELGAYSRMLGKLDQAEKYLGEAMKLVDENDLEPTWWATIGIRMAHVYQWQKRFELAQGMLKDILEACELIEQLEGYRSFARQHLGKLYFDMGDFEAALDCLEQAMADRENLGDEELVKSTSRAIQIVRERLEEEMEVISS